MVEIALNAASQRFDGIDNGLLGKRISAGNFLPHQQAKIIRPVIVPRILQLLMLACAVITKLERPFNIGLDGISAERGDEGF